MDAAQKRRPRCAYRQWVINQSRREPWSAVDSSPGEGRGGEGDPGLCAKVRWVLLRSFVTLWSLSAECNEQPAGIDVANDSRNE